ncbi:MAG: methionyl-tRNA formyltransferase [Candidatus Adiutrix sp.]|jgi:methionyl-tRNA formyltransferase|nr:methionyl-tRNA formyltransferase [Candidatus Adiutrix sp.]
MTDRQDALQHASAADPWRLIFFGSAEFALPALKALAAGPDEVVLAVTPPPAPAGRGRQLCPSPVAAIAAELGVEALETKSVKKPEIIAAIRAARPDLLVVAAYGGFLPPELLNLCPFPPLNIHPSLLPRHRGAAPVNWSLMAGDGQVGVSIIFLEEAMDAGPILSQRAFPVIGPDSAGTWEARLAQAGAEDLLRVIADLKRGEAQPQPQDAALATVNPLLRKEDGRVAWNRPAAALAGLMNGLDPWPGAQARFAGKSLKLFGASAAKISGPAEPGRVLGLDEAGRLLIAAQDGAVAVEYFQPEGKKRMAAADFQRGYRPERLEDA